MRPLVLSGRKVDKNDHRIYVQYKGGEQISPKEHNDHMKEGQNDILEEIVDPEDPPLNNPRETLHQEKR